MIVPLGKRQTLNNCPPNTDCTSPFNDWVRWIILAGVVVFFFLAVVLCSCLSARRRRRAGRQPYYGTGWATHLPAYSQHNNNAAYQQPAPPYSRDAPPEYGAPLQQQQQHDGYLGPASHTSPQQNGTIELQQPGGSYFPAGRERQDEYAPPVGPPPGTNKKGDDVVVR